VDCSGLVMMMMDVIQNMHVRRNKRIAPLPFFYRCRKRRLKDLTPAMECDQYAVFLIAKSFLGIGIAFMSLATL
jgi:hypothetical protein